MNSNGTELEQVAHTYRTIGRGGFVNRVHTESWILEKVLKFAQQFPDLEEVPGVFFKVSIGHLFGNLESRKKIIVMEKSLEKVLNFGSKNLYELCVN